MKKQGISPTNANVRKIIEECKVDGIIVPGIVKGAINEAFGEEVID